MNKLDILVFGAHPDDAELGAGGTIAKETQAGKKVGVIDLTCGELGTRGTPELRDQEAQRAAELLGLEIRENLGMADGFFEVNRENQLLLIQKVRQYQPDIVLCNAVDDRHIDHGKGSRLQSEACFLSGLRKIETLDPKTGELQDPWRPQWVYHYIQWKNLEPDFAVDISGFMETKIEAIKAYSSQFFDPDSTEPETPISSRNFFESVRYRAQDLGRLVGVEYAEGFTTERLPAVDRLGNLR
ncbi:bacillithiol biosynthesis deacetylase BshB1 [Aureicoccus marinus]|jgi:bacillithiol biosynthesis deacetylase BshB1|uniref:Bacillithiol biosynthesis deacetylase BshB1 n=1 Tax=Aureicoccus marinus TaxID=754435 RepID=A0A2S7T5C5_9FLAO|nr:bacillithiol biosynthesis deacetylase BshB1 [Aureicoccus marinus]PQJ15129.1 bacillithiol biosynthesis deacetylase BshB1 [Aureicoccus marinus]